MMTAGFCHVESVLSAPDQQVGHGKRGLPSIRPVGSVVCDEQHSHPASRGPVRVVSPPIDMVLFGRLQKMVWPYRLLDDCLHEIFA